MAEETHYLAQTDIVTISVANSNLDGTGTVYQLCPTPSSNGSLIKNIFIKATGATRKGMIRFFVKTGGVFYLLREVPVEEISVSSITSSFELTLPMNFCLDVNSEIYVSTETGDVFNIICERLDWSYYSSSVRTDTTNYSVNWKFGYLDTANPNRDGTGTIVQIYTSGSSGSYIGTSITSITIKAIENTTIGMVRLYITNSMGSYLFKEINIPTQTFSSINPRFERTISFENNLDIQTDLELSASTENSELFDVSVTGNDYKYIP